VPEGQHHWIWHRLHTALGGLLLIGRVCDGLDKAPLGETVETAYDIAQERMRAAGSQLDRACSTETTCPDSTGEASEYQISKIKRVLCTSRSGTHLCKTLR
jgi:hypothetical protein